MDPKRLIELFEEYKSGDEKSLELLCKKAEEFMSLIHSNTYSLN